MNNNIGQFKIGVSQIGDLPIFNWINTIISQYANSPILFQLIENINSYLDQTANIDNFYDAMFDIETAQGIGLDIWGKIVGVSRIIPVVSVGGYLSFAGTNPNGEFGQAPFYSGQTLTSNYALSDYAFRTLILAKALANISDNSIPSINQILLTLFPNRGPCYVFDGDTLGNYVLGGYVDKGYVDGIGIDNFSAPMTMTYVFEFSLTSVEQAIVLNSGVLPRPSGVAVFHSY